MPEKKRAPRLKATRTTKRVAKKPERPVAASAHDRPRIEDLAAQLQGLRDQVELLSRTVDTSVDASTSRSRRLGALGEALERTVEEVRREKLDRERLLELASAIAAIARILGERAAAFGNVGE